MSKIGKISQTLLTASALVKDLSIVVEAFQSTELGQRLKRRSNTKTPANDRSRK